MRQLFAGCSYSPHFFRRFLPAAALVLLSLTALVFELCEPGALSSREGRCAYLASLGYEADEQSEELREIVLPEEFDAILEYYTRLQLAQGFDLRPAAGKKCLCASYDLENCSGWDGRVIAVLYICRGRVIGGDVHTADVSGFMHALRPAGDL